MKKLVILALMVGGLYADPSAFGAGNLDSDNPYGLTKDETYIWKNKQNIKKLQKIVSEQQKIIKKQTQELNKLKLQFLNYKLKIDNFEQRLSGIESVLPSTDALNQKIKNLKDDLNNTNQIMFALKDEITNLKEVVNNNKKVNDENIKTIINLVEKLAQNLDKLQQKKADWRNLSNRKIFDLAMDEFKKSQFSKAKEKFLYLYNKKYNLSVVTFYLGEIEYRLAHYKTALAYYKKVITLKKAPKYIMDDLLYHTGYSFEKLGNIEAAKKSYIKLLKDYPKSILVKYAKKRLDNLEKHK